MLKVCEKLVQNDEMLVNLIKSNFKKVQWNFDLFFLFFSLLMLKYFNTKIAWFLPAKLDEATNQFKVTKEIKTYKEPKRGWRAAKSTLEIVPIPKKNQLNYTFTGHGHLIHQKHEYIWAFANGKSLITTYKCIKHKSKAKCAVVLKAQGKYLVSITGLHTHWKLLERGGAKVRSPKRIFFKVG